jgi:hypothetical protein
MGVRGIPTETANQDASAAPAAKGLRYNHFNTTARLSEAYRQCGATGENADVHAARLMEGER